MMKKIVRFIHVWVSVPFGLLIAVICFSGAALVFEDEWMEWRYSDRYFAEKTAGERISLGEAAAAVSRKLPDSVSVTGITVFADPRRNYEVDLSRPRRAAVWVDPYTGEIKGKKQRTPFFSTMFRLHRWLFDRSNPGETVFVGKRIVGITTALFVGILLSGVIVWIPRSRRLLKRRLTVAVGKGWTRFWYDLHLAGGMYAVVFLLAMSLTGLTWSFPWYRTAFYRVFGVETSSPSRQGSDGKAAEKRNGKDSSGRTGERDSNVWEWVCWQRVYETLRKENPGYRQISVSHGSARVSFGGFGNRRASDRYAFDSRTGAITEVVRYRDSDESGKIRGWIYSVHVGSWGGPVSKALTFSAALIGGFLPLTGYYFWFKKRRTRRKRKKAISAAR